jgi:hypothetical protein
MNNATVKLQGFLVDNGYWAEMVADSGAKDKCCLYLNIGKEHFFSIYLNNNNAFVVRVDGSDYTVECTTMEFVLSVIKMAIFCGGWE